MYYRQACIKQTTIKSRQTDFSRGLSSVVALYRSAKIIFLIQFLLEVYKILCRYYIHIASFGSLPCFLLFSFCATWRRNQMPLYYLNFEGGRERGGMLGVWVIWFVQEFFSPKPLVMEFFPDMQRCNIFSSVIRHERYLFQCRNIFRRASPYKKFFPLEISLYYIFLWNHS